MTENGRPLLHREGFAALDGGGLDWDSLPLRLYAKGNRRFWNAADIDLSRDAEDWSRLDAPARRAFTGLAAMFLAGEEAVTRDLQPFLAAMSAEGRFGDEMYLTQFCFEEARHVEVFRRWLDAVGIREDLNGMIADNEGHRAIFSRALPEALQRLHADPSPANQVRASITYNHIVEGTLALTGYHAWQLICENLGVFPGMKRIVELIGDDERRHMAWGTYTCRRHVAADPDNWTVVETRMRELLPSALRAIDHASRQYPPELFGVGVRELMRFASGRARRRLQAIESARYETRVDDRVAEELEEAFARDERRAARVPTERVRIAA